MTSPKKGTKSTRKTVKSAPGEQQNYIMMDVAGSKLTTASAKPNEDYVVCTGDLKSAVKVPQSVKQEGDYLMCTGDTESQLSSKRQRKAGGKAVCDIHRKGKGSAKGFYNKRRTLCISIGIIGGLIVFAGITVGIYFAVTPSESESGTIPSTSSSTPLPIFDEYGLLAYDAICIPQYLNSSPTPASNVNWKECIAGPPPRHDSCSGSATCTFYQYRAAWNASIKTWTLDYKIDNVTMPYEKETVPNREKNATQLLCRTTSDNLGLCNGSTCTGARVKDESSWYNESKWEDNCDEPNPCWQGSAIRNFSQNGITRADCLEMDNATCGEFSYRAAVVWMQHLRCDSGKDRTRKVPCRGVPLKLWVCSKCNASATSMDLVNNRCEKEGQRLSPCAYNCIRKYDINRINETLSDGAACLNITGGSDKTGYCYRGTCYRDFATLNETTRHELDITECRRKKEK